MKARSSQETAARAASFDDVYDEHFDFVWRVLCRLAGRAQADDLAQEVFVVVHRRLGEWEGRAKLTTWLFRIAWRVAQAHGRRERARRAVLGLFGLEPREAAPAPLREVERAEEAVRLGRALRRLTWKKRAVLVLHEVEGWPCELIAERLGIPVGTVHTRLHHARRDLEAALKEET